MTTHMFRGDALDVAKEIWVGFPSASSVASGVIKIGLGSHLLELDEWDADEVVAAWNGSGDTLLTRITADVPTEDEATAVGLTSPIRLIHQTAGEDFMVTVLLNDAELLLAHTLYNMEFDVAPTGGNFTLTFEGQTTGAITWSGTGATLATNMSTALIALSNVASGDIVVTYVALPTPHWTFDLSGGAYAGLSVGLMTSNRAGLTGGNATVDVATVTQGAIGTTEVQTINFYGGPTGGSFSASWNGFLVSGLSFPLAGATFQTALESIMGTGNVTVSGSGSGPYTVTAAGALVLQDISPIIIDPTTLTGGTIFGTMTTTTPGVAGTDETQYLSLQAPSSAPQMLTLEKTGTVSGGTFRFAVVYGATTTYSANIAWNAKLYEVCAALEAMYATALGSTYFGPYFAPWDDAVANNANLTIPAAQALGPTVCAFQVIGNLDAAASAFSPFGPLGDSLSIDDALLTGSSPNYEMPGPIYSFGGSGSQLTTSGTFKLSYAGSNTSTLTFTRNGNEFTSPTAAQVQTALEALVGTGNVLVTNMYDAGEAPNILGGSIGLFKIVFTAASSGTPIGNITGFSVTLGDAIPFELTSVTLKDGLAGTKEVQTLTLSGTPANGTFRLNYEGEWTGDLAYNISNANLKIALEGLSTLPANSLTLGGGALPGTPVTITFTGPLQYRNVTPILIDDSKLKYTVVITTPGVTGTSEVQTLTMTGSPFGGTFTISYSGQTTAAIAYNASIATISTELIALSNIGPSDVVVTGGPTINAGVVTVTFLASLGNVAQMTTTPTLHNAVIDLTMPQPGGLAGSLTIKEVVRGQGGSYYNCPENWDTGEVPSSGDTLIIDDANSEILYGIKQHDTFLTVSTDGKFMLTSRKNRFTEGQKVHVYNVGGALPPDINASVSATGFFYIRNPGDDGTFYLSLTKGGTVLANDSGLGTGTRHIRIKDLTLTVYSRYPGAQIGLPRYRSDVEVAEYLDTYFEAGFTLIELGLDSGDGLSFGRFNTMDAATEIIVHSSSSPDGSDSEVPAVLFLIDNNTATIRVDDGSVGIAMFAGESSELLSIDHRGGTMVVCNSVIAGNVDSIPGLTIKRSTVAGELNNGR